MSLLLDEPLRAIRVITHATTAGERKSVKFGSANLQ